MAEHDGKSSGANRGGINRGVLLRSDDLTAADIERFREKIDRSGKHWFWTGARNGTTGVFTVGGKSKTAKRIMWALEHGQVDAGETVITVCEASQCFRHLDLGTAADAQRLRVANGHGVLERSIIDRIRQLALSGRTRGEIAAEVDVAEEVVGRIRGNHTYVDPRYTPPIRKMVSGEQQHSAKMTVEKVADLRRRHTQGEMSHRLAKEVGLAESTMYDLLHGRTWKSEPGVCTIRHCPQRRRRQVPV